MQYLGVPEFVAQAFLGGINDKTIVYIEHQLGHFGEAPELTAGDAMRIQLVDLAVAEKRNFVEGFGHLRIIGGPSCNGLAG